MQETCPDCGLPKELCVCSVMSKEKQQIKIYTDKRRFDKLVTVIVGLSKDTDVKDLTKHLKSKLACGGTYKDDKIELQGNHKSKLLGLLIKFGFAEDQIEIK